MRAIVQVATWLLLTPAWLGAQSPIPLVRCDRPDVPLGLLRGAGAVQYLLGPDGRPDTMSVAILEADGISPAALRSAAVRQLSACRLAADTAYAGPRLVRQVIAVTDSLVRLSSARPTTPGDTLDATPAPLDDPGRPRAADDPSLEERPGFLRCEEPTWDTRIESRPGSPLSASRPVGGNPFGRVRVRVVVTPSGRPDPGSVRIVENSLTRGDAVDFRWLGSCTYAPGRVDGRPVAAYVESGLIVSP